MDMAMKKISALQSLLKYKFALLIAAGAVTALFVVFVATQTTTINHFLAGANVLKPHTASANLGWDDGCSDAFWAWWMSGDDDDYYDAEAACSGGGGGGGGGDSSGGGGWDDGCSWGWGGCEDTWGGNDGNDGPPYGTCYPGYNMDASGYCYPNGGVDNGCYNSQYNYTYDDCDPAAPYDPTPSLCSDPYYAQMNINECGVVNVPDNNDPSGCDEINDNCVNSPNPPTLPGDGPSSCKSPNGFTITCSSGFHCDTVNGGCAPNSTPVTTDGDPDGCDETHDNCTNPPAPTPPPSGFDEHGCSTGFGYFPRGGVWGCYDMTHSAEYCADVTYALNNKIECGVVDVPAGPQDPVTINTGSCLDYAFYNSHPACAGHPPDKDCLLGGTLVDCDELDLGSVQPKDLPPLPPAPPATGTSVDELECQSQGGQWDGAFCNNLPSTPSHPASPISTGASGPGSLGCAINEQWETRGGEWQCFPIGGAIDRPTPPTRNGGDGNTCEDESGNACDLTPSGGNTSAPSSSGGGRSLIGRGIDYIRGLMP